MSPKLVIRLGICIVLLLLVSSAAGVAVADSHVEVSAADETVEQGEKATIPVTINQTPNGLSGFKIIASTDAGATIQSVSIGSNFYNTTAKVTDDGTAEAAGTDFSGSVADGAENVTLFEIDVRGESVGTSAVTLKVEELEDAGDPPKLLNPATDSGEITVNGADAGGDAVVVNQTASTITPTSVATNETRQFQVDVQIENITSTDRGGEVDVKFERFQSGNEFTIGYSASDITGDTLTVSKSTSVTAPNTRGTVEAYVSNLRQENESSDTDTVLIEDERIIIDTINVTATDNSSTAPVYQSGAATATSISLGFNQAVNITAGTDGFTVQVNGDQKTVTVSNSSEAVNNITLTLSNHTIGPTNNVSVRYDGSTKNLLNISTGAGAESFNINTDETSEFDNSVPFTVTAAFEYNPTTPESLQSITFDASNSEADAGIANYTWKFGQQGTDRITRTYTNEPPEEPNTYDSSGEYNVTLTITDTDGRTDTETKTVSVTEGSTSDGAPGFGFLPVIVSTIVFTLMVARRQIRQ